MINIRKATVKDFETIQSFQKKLSEYEAQFTNEFNINWAYSEKGKFFFERHIKGRNVFTLVAVDEKKLIGYLAVTIKKTDFRNRNKLALLDHLFVNEDYRKKGVGNMLIEEAVKKLRERKVPRFQLYVLKDNINAIDFYNKNKFKEFILIMEKDI